MDEEERAAANPTMARRLTPAALLAVFAGGTAGTAMRVLVTPPHAPDGFPLATFVINVVGAGLLGFLAQRLVRRPGLRSTMLGLLVGTGFLGGLTTYSALAVDTVQLVRSGEAEPAVAYGLGTLLAGGLATALGISLGRRGRA